VLKNYERFLIELNSANELAHNNEYDKCVMVMKDCIQECINKYGEQSIITVRLLKEYASHLLRLKREESIRLAVETVDRTVLIIQLMVEVRVNVRIASMILTRDRTQRRSHWCQASTTNCSSKHI
jgi:hypothetical protein